MRHIGVTRKLFWECGIYDLAGLLPPVFPKKWWEQIVGGFFVFGGLYGLYSSGEWAIVGHCDFLVGVPKELLHGSMLSFHTDAALLRAGSIKQQRICFTGWSILSSAFEPGHFPKLGTLVPPLN